MAEGEHQIHSNFIYKRLPELSETRPKPDLVSTTELLPTQWGAFIEKSPCVADPAVGVWMCDEWVNVRQYCTAL